MNEHRISNPYDKQYYIGIPNPESQIPKGLWMRATLLELKFGLKSYRFRLWLMTRIMIVRFTGPLFYCMTLLVYTTKRPQKQIAKSRLDHCSTFTRCHDITKKFKSTRIVWKIWKRFIFGGTPILPDKKLPKVLPTNLVSNGASLFLPQTKSKILTRPYEKIHQIPNHR